MIKLRYQISILVRYLTIGSDTSQKHPQERIDGATKNGFFSEGFLGFGPNNIRNFGDLFKGNLGSSNHQSHHEEKTELYNPDEYYEIDDTNINYVDDDEYYTNDDPLYHQPNFGPEGHDANTRNNAFNFQPSHGPSHGDTTVGVHQTVLGK